MKAQHMLMWGRHRGQRVSPGVAASLIVLAAVGLAAVFSGAGEPTGADDRPVAVIEVSLVEYQIKMLPTALPGKMTLSVTNAGTMEHNFEIESKDFEKKFDVNLKPGETKSLQVDLAAGTYTVYCPIENHKDLGMQMDLTVAKQLTE